MSEQSVYDLETVERGTNWQTWAAWPFVAGALLGVALVAWALSFPGTNFVATLWIPFAAGLFALLWLAFAIAAFVSDRSLAPGKVVAWLLTPLVAIVAAPIVLSDLPLLARLELSRGSLDPVARDVAAGRRSPPADGTLGLYTIYRAERLHNGFAFLVEGAGFIDPCGLAFSEQGEPAVEAAVSLWHIRGPWYGWCWDF